MAQRDTNPYPYSDSNKRYMTYDWYLKRRFGGKVAKVPIDINTTCPNLDGTKGHGGCIYCLNGSSAELGGGSCVAVTRDSILSQYECGREVMSRKWKPVGYIPYLQSNTNTYGNLTQLRDIYGEVSKLEDALMLDIATRADCLGDDVLALLSETAEKIPLTVELGLQTTNEETAKRINRCHTYEEFLDGYTRLRSLADRINEKYPSDSFIGKRFTIALHLINGLPGEREDEMLQSICDVADLAPDIVKIHLMHVLSNTALGDMYERGEYTPMEREDYVRIVCDQLEYLPEETVIGRITGDGIAEYLLAPQWSRRKTEVVNEIDKEMYRRNSRQGLRYKAK